MVFRDHQIGLWRPYTYNFLYKFFRDRLIGLRKCIYRNRFFRSLKIYFLRPLFKSVSENWLLETDFSVSDSSVSVYSTFRDRFYFGIWKSLFWDRLHFGLWKLFFGDRYLAVSKNSVSEKLFFCCVLLAICFWLSEQPFILFCSDTTRKKLFRDRIFRDRQISVSENNFQRPKCSRSLKMDF
jgi:hypothetical protein